MEDSSKDLDESLFANFKCLTVRDYETGETLCVKRDVETGESLSRQWGSGAIQKRTGFRIPFAFLKRETSGDDCDVFKPGKAETSSEVLSGVCGSAATSASIVTANDVVVAEVPSAKLSSLFCRKRKNVDAKLVAKPEGSNCMATCKLPRFLEGREGLLRAIQLFLVALSLVSPGFFFPAIFLIKLMCHYREHQQNWDLDIGDHPACFLTRQVCRVCRERTNTERMLKLHSSMASVNKLKGKVAENNNCQRNDDCGFCN